MHSFVGTTADEVWRAAAATLVEHARHQPSRAGLTHELLHVAMELDHPRERWVVSREPALNPGAYVVEVTWILRGREDAGLINFWNPQFPRYAGNSPTYYGAYGHRIRKSFGLDQLEDAYQTLRDNPDSRQVCLAIWDPAKDLPQQGGEPRSTDIPCNVISVLKLRDGKLHWTQIMRSNDLWRGLPVNLVQFTCLQEIMAGWLGVELGSYCHWSDSLHVYDQDIEKVAQSVPISVPPNTDSLALPKGESDAVISEIERRLDHILAADVTENKIRQLSRLEAAPAAYQNLLYVAVADAARRKGWQEVASEIMQHCTNPALSLLWKRWAERTGNQ